MEKSLRISIEFHRDFLKGVKYITDKTGNTQVYWKAEKDSEEAIKELGYSTDLLYMDADTFNEMFEKNVTHLYKLPA